LDLSLLLEIVIATDRQRITSGMKKR